MQLSELARRTESRKCARRVGRLQFVKTKHAHRAIKLIEPRLIEYRLVIGFHAAGYFVYALRIILTVNYSESQTDYTVMECVTIPAGKLSPAKVTHF